MQTFDCDRFIPVAGRELQRDWFRRTMEPQLEATGTTVAAGRGRPAELFRRKTV